MKQTGLASLTGFKAGGSNSVAALFSSRGQQTEGLLLVALALALPLFEAPKNILVLAYAIVWLFNRMRSGQWGGPWDRWDTLFTLFLGSYLASALFGHFGAHAFGELSDVLRFMGLAWLVRRARYGAPFCILLLRGFVLATIVAVAAGFWELFVAGHGPYLELRSVGHVNHSSIYLAMAALVAQCLWQLDRHGNAFHARLDLALIVIMLGTQIVMASRASLLGYLAAVLLLLVRDRAYFAALAKQFPGRMLAIVLVLMVGVAGFLSLSASWMPNGGVLAKIESGDKPGRQLSMRDRVWAFGLEAWRLSPTFGIGTGQFDRIRLEDVCAWRAARLPAQAAGSAACPVGNYYVTSHAHSLYVTALVERGVIGLLILIAFLGAWVMAVWRRPDNAAAATINSAAGSALIVTLVTGVANTTLHHEHGLFALCLLALWLGLDQTKNREPLQEAIKA